MKGSGCSDQAKQGLNSYYSNTKTTPHKCMMFWLKDTKTYTSFLKFCSDQARQGLNSYYSVQPVNTQTTLHLGKEAHDV